MKKTSQSLRAMHALMAMNLASFETLGIRSRTPRNTNPLGLTPEQRDVLATFPSTRDGIRAKKAYLKELRAVPTKGQC